MTEEDTPKPSGLVIACNETIRSFLYSASTDPHLIDELRQIASNLSSQTSIPYKSLRCLWFASLPSTRPKLFNLFKGSDFIISSPKPREKSEELKARLEKLADLAERKAYKELVKDITPVEDTTEPFSSYKDQLGFGLHVGLTMFTGYLVGYATFRALFSHNPVMNAAGGILGLVCAMLLETLLFIIRTSNPELASSSATSNLKNKKRLQPFNLSIENHLDAPSKIQSCLNIFSDHFRYGRQEDAHEFLRYVIDACHNTCLRLSNNNNHHHHGNSSTSSSRERETTTTTTSVVKEIFGGALQSQVKCLSCGFESNKTDDIMDISLDLFQTNSLRDAMHRFFQPELLDGSNKYKCEKCKKLVAARKQMSILQAPNILVIQLKILGIHGGKIDRTIAFEETLVLSSYMCKGCQDPHPEYNLFGTVVHSGYSPESGHYYAYIKDVVGRWYCCNDSHVSLSTLQEVLSEKVYILFFSRTNPRPRPTKTAIATNGVKSPDCIVNDASPSPKAAKTVTAKTYDTHYLEKDRPMMPKNGKPPSSPQIKFGNLNGVDPRKVHSNGNGNGIVNGNGNGNGIVNGNGNGIGNGNGNGNGNVYKPGLVGKHIELKKSGMEKNKDDMPSVSIKNGASGAVYHTNKQTILVPKDGIQSVSCKDMSQMSGATKANHALNDEHANCPSVISGSKRTSLDKVSEGLLKQGAYWAADTKFKEALGADASAFLRSCGWSDEVHNSMRARKRQCAQAAGITASNIELKKLLMTEAKQTFIAQIPESLKERLIERIRAVSQRKKVFGCLNH